TSTTAATAPPVPTTCLPPRRRRPCRRPPTPTRRAGCSSSRESIRCHGPRGAGDGPDARRGEITPADFTSVVFMRRETPQRREVDRAVGARLWRERCAGCHGAAGAGVAGKAADLTRPGSLVDRSDRVLFVRLSRPPHPEPFAGLSDAERWQAVGRARALSLGGEAAATPP